MKDILKWTVIGCLFAVPFLTLYVENEYFFPFITGKNFWFRILVDIALVAYIALALYEPKYRPRWSWILGGAGVLLVVMFFANLLGEHPRSSFWSNFERMDGYVSIVHTYLYMLLLGSVLRTKQEWIWLFNTSLVVAVLAAVGGLAQYFGITSIIDLYNINASVNRVDSTLGNPAYMAIYMLFHIFMVIWLIVQAKSTQLRVAYVATLPLFLFILVETGTRGTAVGLAVGVIVMSAYIAAFGAQYQTLRRYAIGGLALVFITIAAFVAFKDTEMVQNNPNLARIANISLGDLEIRSIIWGMAWEGVQERPLLGWGQSNFNYVFNEQYDPRLYGQEHWFDRAHNIFMDWLIAGGFLGLLAYLSIFAACAYYLFVRPQQSDTTTDFTVLERGILLGILAGYFTHNLVVFDNIVSYIFFAIILGLIHARVSTPIASISTKKVDESIITQAYLPVGLVSLVAVIYFVHAPGMAAASDIIKAFRAVQPSVELGVQRPPEGPEAMHGYFIDALERDSFAHQEITEQISQQAMGIARNSQVSVEIRQLFASTSEEQLLKLVEEKPNDARVHVFIASYYRATNQVEKAVAQMQRARELSPDKQTIINQQGFTELARQDYAAALGFFKESFELDTNNVEAREYYAVALLYTGNEAAAIGLIDSDATLQRFARSQFMLDVAREAGANSLQQLLYTERVIFDAATAQNWATLSALQLQAGDTEAAAATLDQAGTIIPEFAITATCIADNIRAGVAEPQTGC